MTEIASQSASIKDLIQRIGYYKGSPTRIASATMDFFDAIVNGKVDMVDPTTPFTMLFESSCVHSALAINESLLNLRRSYVGLSESDQDVYRHMTDDEYIGRFATPGSADVTFMIDFQDLLNNVIFDPVENCEKAIIPRDSFIAVDTYTFTLQYPIVFRRFQNKVIQITYDADILSPIYRPSNNIVTFFVRRDQLGKSILYFTIPVKQMKVASTNVVIQRESVFTKDIPFDDQFIFARVFQKNNTTSGWSELYTTHSDQVFDRNRPTAVFQVTTGSLNVTIPFIYNSLGSVNGQIRIDIFTTKGNIDINLGTYSADKFSVKLRNIDKERDDSVYSNIWSDINYFAYSGNILTPGTDGIGFEALRSKVVNYAFGNFNIPITQAQLDTVGELNGFSIVRNADTLTNRYLLGTRAIPDISVKDSTTNTDKLLSRANIGMVRFSAEISELESSDNVVNNNGRLTLLSNTAFQLDNGKSTLVEASTIASIRAQPAAMLVSSVNENSYAYTPYYYVFDLQASLLDVRPYDLDHPDSANLSFVLQNSTLMLVVNTNSYAIAKTDKGYRLTIMTLSGSSYKQLANNQVGVQLRLINEDSSLVGTINGVLSAVDPTTGERIYTFDIETSYDINANHSIQVINAYNEDGLLSDFYINLNSTVDIIYTTISLTVGYISDETDTLINKSTLPSGSVGNSHDRLDLFFGKHLEHLWARSRTFASGLGYQTSPVDVQAIYEHDVYAINPNTNSMLFFDNGGLPYYQKLHSQGEAVVVNGQAVYKYRAGSPILDNNGQPIPASSLISKNEFDVFVLDGSLLFATDPNYVSYRDQVSRITTNWIVEDILEIQARLIERTEIFFYPQASLGVTQIVVNGTQNAYIDSEQSLTLTVYLDESVINDIGVQNAIADTASRFMDDNISRPKFTINQLESDLRTLFGTTVPGITISGLGGDLNYKAISVSDQHNRLCIKRKLVANTDNSITIKPDINIVFVKF